MVFSRVTPTPLRRPSDGLSPTPMMLTGAPGSSDSAMTTATRLVPRSRPTVFFRRDKVCWDASWNVGMTRVLGRVGGSISAPGSSAGLDFVGRGDLGGTPCGRAGGADGL